MAGQDVAKMAINGAMTALAVSAVAYRSSFAAKQAAAKAGSDCAFASNLSTVPWKQEEDEDGEEGEVVVTDKKSPKAIMVHVRAGAEAAQSSSDKASKAALLAHDAACAAVRWAEHMETRCEQPGCVATFMLPSGPVTMVPVEWVQTLHFISVLVEAAKAHAAAAAAFASTAEAHAAAVAAAYDWLA
jgi:hypothetical protein